VRGAKVVGILFLSWLLSISSASQRRGGRGPHPSPPPHNQAPPQNKPQNQPQPENKPSQPSAQKPTPLPPQAGGQPANRQGDWLWEHKDLPPAQQEKLLESEPYFKKLSPQRQAELKDRLHKFNSLPPEQRERALRQMKIAASLTPDQRKQLRETHLELQALPENRRLMVHKALHSLSQMSPDDRQQVMQSERFRSTFSDQEQGIIKRLAEMSPTEPLEKSGQEPK
jgi:hypothetical protein